jgi:hypothetical protein
MSPNHWIHATSHGRVIARQQARGAVERAREPAPQPACELLGREKGGPGFAEEMVERVGSDPGTERTIREHQIQLLTGELAQEVFHHPVLAADQVDRLFDLERRLDQLLRENPGQRVGDADGETQRPLRRPSLEHSHQILAQGKDLVRIAERAAAYAGEHQAAAGALEQLLAQHMLQPVHLTADRRLRKVELCARARDATVAGDCPEVLKVMVVQPLHAARVARTRPTPVAVASSPSPTSGELEANFIRK